MQNQSPRTVRSGVRTRLSVAAGMSSRVLDLLRDASRSPIRDTISTTISRRIAMNTGNSVSSMMAAAATRSPVTRSTATGSRRSASISLAGSRSTTSTSSQSTVSTRSTRSSFSASSGATASTARVTTFAVSGRNSSASGSRVPPVRRRAEALPVIQERSSASTARRQIGETATGSRGRSTRTNVHVDKEVQTENRSDIDEVSVSLNALKRRRQSLSPTNLPCAICFNEMHPKGGRTLISLKCGHVFCNDCIEKSLERSKCCPLCLDPIQKRHFRKIYL